MASEKPIDAGYLNKNEKPIDAGYQYFEKPQKSQKEKAPGLPVRDSGFGSVSAPLFKNDRFFVAPWMPLFWTFLVMCALGFKARVGSPICTWLKYMSYMLPKSHLWCNTC